MRRSWSLALLGMLACGAWAGASAGCGSDGGEPPADQGEDAGLGNETGSLLGGNDAQAQKLVIAPVNPTLDVTGPGITQAFTATVGGQPVHAAWSLDVADVGTIDGNGLFTASGVLGGPVTVTAMAG